jgi:hypothetical protein
MMSPKLRRLQITLLADYNDDVIDQFYFSAVDWQKDLQTEGERMSRKIETNVDLDEAEKRELIDSFSDDLAESDEVKALSEQMVIMYLFKTVEIAMKRMLARSGLTSNKKISASSQRGNYSALIRELGIALEELPDHAAYDALRSINNSIKHQGRATKELAQLAGWRENDELTNLWEHYNSLKPGVRRFVKAFSEALMSKIPLGD